LPEHSTGFGLFALGAQGLEKLPVDATLLSADTQLSSVGKQILIRQNLKTVRVAVCEEWFAQMRLVSPTESKPLSPRGFRCEKLEMPSNYLAYDSVLTSTGVLLAAHRIPKAADASVATSPLVPVPTPTSQPVNSTSSVALSSSVSPNQDELVLISTNKSDATYGAILGEWETPKVARLRFYE
jgi:hypothetical protein